VTNSERSKVGANGAMFEADASSPASFDAYRPLLDTIAGASSREWMTARGQATEHETEDQRADADAGPTGEPLSTRARRAVHRDT
jgi:hypothetical protein